MNKAKQDILTPDVIINSLMNDDEGIVSNELTASDYCKQVKNSTILKKIEEAAEIKIIDAVYNIENTEVDGCE
ncbi:hypothetical protein [Aequorivita xiaoshiensis]|uniref:Uncharacterized protein n=1 Tax=Aequorivita xiaoshiensis TaxID=2874476 RepID=A0A9X1R3M9_9FLAO|nr:hypothetical protein [Aequorivita xiaoshiensis]MCG2430434.1 hypothetical protein [Aequorivita xiaoshiensis]